MQIKGMVVAIDATVSVMREKMKNMVVSNGATMPQRVKEKNKCY